MALLHRQIRNLLSPVACAVAIFGLLGPALAADFEVVANKSVPVSSLSRAELQSIFLGEKSKWDNGKAIKIVVLDDGAAHRAFVQGITGKTPAQFDNHWKRLVFTGKAALPKSFEDSAQLVQFVAGHPGAIGYAAPGQGGGPVKIISVK